MTVQWADIVTGTLAGIPLGAFLASHLMRNLKRAWNGQAEETGEHIRMEVSKVMGEVESKILSRIETSTLKDPRDAGEEIRQSLEQILADLKAELEWHRDIAELIAQDRNYTETANIGFTKDGILNTLRRLEEKRIHLESFKKMIKINPLEVK